MDINKGDLVKLEGTWGVVKSVKPISEVAVCLCLTTGNPAISYAYGEVEQVVHPEPTGKFLNVLSQKEKIAYANYYTKEAGNMLTGIENRTSGATGKPSDGIVRNVPVIFKFSSENDDGQEQKQGLFSPKEEKEFTLNRIDTSGRWKKTQSLFDAFGDQAPYPLDFDNFDYGDVEGCYDEERDYLVIKCVDDFIEHMMTTR